MVLLEIVTGIMPTMRGKLPPPRVPEDCPQVPPADTLATRGCSTAPSPQPGLTDLPISMSDELRLLTGSSLVQDIWELILQCTAQMRSQRPTAKVCRLVSQQLLLQRWT